MNHNSKYYSIEIVENLEIYNQMILSLIYGDSNYKLIGIRANKFFGKMDKCLYEKNKLFNHLINYLGNSTDRALRLPFQTELSSENQQKKLISDYFMYKNGDEINFTCSKERNSNIVLFEVGFYSNKFRETN